MNPLLLLFLLPLYGAAKVASEANQPWFLITVPKRLSRLDENTFSFNIQIKNVGIRVDSKLCGAKNTVKGRITFSESGSGTLKYRPPFNDSKIRNLRLTFVAFACNPKRIAECGNQRKLQIFSKSITVPILQQPLMLFIESSQAIYQPGETVLFRVLPLSLISLQPVLRNGGGNTTDIALDFISLQMPSKVHKTIQFWRNQSWRQGLRGFSFKLPQNAHSGTWTIEVQAGETKEKHRFTVGNISKKDSKMKIRLVAPVSVYIRAKKVTFHVCVETGSDTAKLKVFVTNTFCVQSSTQNACAKVKTQLQMPPKCHAFSVQANKFPNFHQLNYAYIITAVKDLVTKKEFNDAVEIKNIRKKRFAVTKKASPRFIPHLPYYGQFQISDEESADANISFWGIAKPIRKTALCKETRKAMTFNRLSWNVVMFQVPPTAKCVRRLRIEIFVIDKKANNKKTLLLKFSVERATMKTDAFLQISASTQDKLKTTCPGQSLSVTLQSTVPLNRQKLQLYLVTRGNVADTQEFPNLGENSIICEDQNNDILGHYKCIEKNNTKIRCLQGWQGQNCLTPICAKCDAKCCKPPSTCRCYEKRELRRGGRLIDRWLRCLLEHLRERYRENRKLKNGKSWRKRNKASWTKLKKYIEEKKERRKRKNKKKIKVRSKRRAGAKKTSNRGRGRWKERKHLRQHFPLFPIEYENNGDYIDSNFNIDDLDDEIMTGIISKGINDDYEDDLLTTNIDLDVTEVPPKIERKTIFERKLIVKFSKQIFPFFHLVIWFVDASNNLVATELAIGGLRWCQKKELTATNFDFPEGQLQPDADFTAKVQTPSNNLQCAVTFSVVSNASKLENERNGGLAENIRENSEIVDRMTYFSNRQRTNAFEISGVKAVTNANYVSKFFDVKEVFKTSANPATEFESPKKIFKTVQSSVKEFEGTAPKGNGITTWQTSMLCFNKDGITQSQNDNFVVFRPVGVEFNIPKSMVLDEVAKVPIEVTSFTEQCAHVTLNLITPNNPATGKKPTVFTTCVCNFLRKKVFATLPAKTKTNFLSISVYLQVITRMADSECRSPSNSTADKFFEKQEITLVQPGMKIFVSNATYLCPQLNSSEFFVNLRPKITRGTIASDSTGGVLVWSGNHLLSLTIASKQGELYFHTGETNLVEMVQNLEIIDYFRKEKIDKPYLVDESKKIIREAFQKQLSYRHQDGSFSPLGNQDKAGSVHFTALLLQTYVALQRHVTLDENIIEGALCFLVSEIRNDGCFTEKGHFFGSRGPERGDRVSLTAFVLRNLFQAKRFQSPWQQRIQSLEAKAVTCLTSNGYEVKDLQSLSTFAVALRADALSRWNLADNMTLAYLDELDRRKTDTEKFVFWQGSPNAVPAIDVETTAYALMSRLRSSDSSTDKLSYAMRSVRWLTSKINHRGKWYGAYDTIAAQQALKEMAEITELAETKVNFRIKRPAESDSLFLLKDSNRIHASAMNLKSPTTLNVTATGSGCVFLRAYAEYSALNLSYPDSAFLLTSTVRHSTGKCESVLLTVCVGYTSKKSPPTIAILRVAMATGWKAKAENKLKTSSNTLARVDMEDNHSWVLYHHHLANNTCVSAELERIIEVKNLAPIQLYVFDYYRPETKQVTFQKLCE